MVLGKTTSATIPSASSSDSRRWWSQFRLASSPIRSSNGTRYSLAQSSNWGWSALGR